jgi:hypothetical protein
MPEEEGRRSFPPSDLHMDTLDHLSPRSRRNGSCRQVSMGRQVLGTINTNSPTEGRSAA